MNLGDAGIHYPTLAGDTLADVLQLIRTQNVGPITFFHLIRRYGSAGAALDALPELSRRGGRAKPLVASSREATQKEIDAVKRFGARMIVYGAPEYPRMLLPLADAPPVITVLGNASLWHGKQAIAMVGARNASANGCQFATRLARELGEQGFIIISGLARGIDSFVHRGAIATGTVGVIAGGIDNIYPPENAPLFAQLREAGAIISELPFGLAPFAGSFPGRNRIIAGMSIGTVVVEASPKSGSLITANFALDNNREVFAVPGSPLDPRARGCNQLIKQGAIMVETTEDILRGLAHVRSSGMNETPSSAYAAAPKTSEVNESELAAMRPKILEKLGMTPILVDELIEQCEATASVVLTVLLELELAGRLSRSAGNKVALLGNAEMALTSVPQ